MSAPRFASRLAWASCAVSLALLAVSLVLILLTRSPAETFPWQAQAIDVVGTMGAPILGGVVASRRPGNPIGWIWLGIGLGFALSSLAGSYAIYALGSLPAHRAVGTVVAGAGWMVAITLVSFALLLFPDGRLPSPRWRFVAWVAVAAGILGLILLPFAPGRSGFAPVENPFGVGGALGEAILALMIASVVVVLVVIVLSALSLVFRYRRSSGIERQQIKWFAYAAGVFALLIPLDLVGVDEVLGAITWDLLNTATSLGIYAAVGVAILRHRLYEIDLIVNRTLVYGSLTVTLALVYVGCVVALQSGLRALTGGESQLAIVASTLAVAALFNPLRRSLQTLIDRRFYRKKYDAAKTLEAFGARLRQETDLDALSGNLVGAVRETVRPEHVSLWLRKPDGEVER